jgi:hypothetical protein
MSTTNRNARASDSTHTARGAAMGVIICSLLLATYAGTSWLAWRNKGITFDEPLHLVAAALQIRKGEFRIDQANPPLWKYYFGVANPAIDMILRPPPGENSAELPLTPTVFDYSTQVLYQTPGNDPRALVNSGRVRMLPLAVLLGALIAFWSWRLAGPLAACVACAGYCLDPNFLAHGLLIKNDVPITLLFTAVMYFVWRTGRAATIVNCASLALLLAAALCTKFSGLLAIPVLAIALLIRAAIPIDWPVLHFAAQKQVRSRLLAGAIIFLVSLFVSWVSIWACYNFRFSSAPYATSDVDRALRFYSTATTGANDRIGIGIAPAQFHNDISPWQSDFLRGSVRWTADHRLLPQSYLAGFLYTAAATAGHPSFLMGEVRLRGWWYYFPAAFLFKTALATLIAIVLAAALWVFPPRPRDPWTISSLALAPVLYTFAAVHSGLDLGLRHIFPVYPFLYIFLGITAARALQIFGKAIVPILIVLLLGLAVESFSAFPDYIPFFNIAVGGSRGGVKLLGDSNIDWGQELPNLAIWQRRNPEYQLMLYYSGTGDPRYYGIQYANLPGSFSPTDQTRYSGQKPYWAISVIAFQGTYLNAKARSFYEPFRYRQPTQILGGCIYLYAP